MSNVPSKKENNKMSCRGLTQNVWGNPFDFSLGNAVCQIN